MYWRQLNPSGNGQVLMVNYRGSTGYGQALVDSLTGTSPPRATQESPPFTPRCYFCTFSQFKSGEIGKSHAPSACPLHVWVRVPGGASAPIASWKHPLLRDPLWRIEDTRVLPSP